MPSVAAPHGEMTGGTVVPDSAEDQRAVQPNDETTQTRKPTTDQRPSSRRRLKRKDRSTKKTRPPTE